MRICNSCNGTGEEIESVYNPSTGEQREYLVTCSNCDGSGEIED
jgi:DnaJ-class molecular chaperone